MSRPGGNPSFYWPNTSQHNLGRYNAGEIVWRNDLSVFIPGKRASPTASRPHIYPWLIESQLNLHTQDLFYKQIAAQAILHNTILALHVMSTGTKPISRLARREGQRPTLVDERCQRRVHQLGKL
jgi:hypothetical protein